MSSTADTLPLERVIAIFVGDEELFLPSTGCPANDYDLKQTWYARAEARIRANRTQALPLLAQRADRQAVRDFLRRIGVTDEELKSAGGS